MFVVWGGAMGIGALTGAVMGGHVGAAAGGVAGFLAGAVLFGLVVWLVKVAAHAVVLVMARDALAGREPILSEALGAVLGRGLDVLVAAFLMWLIVVVGLFLLVVPGLIALFFLLLTPPAVLLEGRGPVDAIRRSMRLVRDNAGAVGVFVVGAILVAALGLLVSGVLGAVPLVGALAAAIVGGALISYLTVVGVRLFQALPER
jgi:hypothetical protein